MQDCLDAVTGLVVWPQTVTERLDNVISRDPEVRRSTLEHLGNCTKHAPDRSVRGVRSLGAPDSIKVTKKLVCAVEQVNDHSCRELFMR